MCEPFPAACDRTETNLTKGLASPEWSHPVPWFGGNIRPRLCVSASAMVFCNRNTWGNEAIHASGSVSTTAHISLLLPLLTLHSLPYRPH